MRLHKRGTNPEYFISGRAEGMRFRGPSRRVIVRFLLPPCPWNDGSPQEDYIGDPQNVYLSSFSGQGLID